MEGEGCILFRVQNSLILDKDLLYLNVTPKGEAESVVAFMVPMDQHCVTLNGIHRDAGHQGQARTLALTQERFWWLTLVEDCKAMIRECQHYCAFEGAILKASLCPIRAYMPLELVHMDFTSIKMDMELNKPPGVENVLVITDHFMRYAMAFITKDQTAKTVASVLYEQFITIFGVPAKLLSDRGTNFTSRLVEELCSAFGIQKCRTTSYHAQCNGQVECFHQTLFCMLGKLTKDKKAQWEKHLPEMLQAYNSTQSAVTGYSPHYLMFGRHPWLLIDFYFPTRDAFECSCPVPKYVDEIRCHFREAYTEAHIQTNLEADWQKQNYDRATSTVQLVLGDAVLLKQDAFQGKRKMKDRWGNEEYEVVRQVTPDMPAYKVHDRSGNARVVHRNRLFLVASVAEPVTPLSLDTELLEATSEWFTLVELTPLECKSDSPEETTWEALIRCLTCGMLLGWLGGILWPLPMVALSSTESGSSTGKESDSDNHEDCSYARARSS